MQDDTISEESKQSLCQRMRKGYGQNSIKPNANRRDMNIGSPATRLANLAFVQAE